jgi:Raf kinase inhibitor-like YbhB/YbcL family protein
MARREFEYRYLHRSTMMRTSALFAVLLVLVTGCSRAGQDGAAESPVAPVPSPQEAPMSPSPPDTASTLRLTSSAFKEGEPIPREFSCHGRDVPPPLAWDGVPGEAAELALLLDDPDAPGARPFVHWVVLGLPPGTTGLEGGSLPAGAREGRNDSGGSGYAGPCPPTGPEHRYLFTLFALPSAGTVDERTDPAQVRPALEAAAIARADLAGTFAS